MSVCPAGVGVPAIGGPPCVENIYQIEIIKVEYERGNQQRSNGNQQQGQGNIPKLLPGVGAIHLGGSIIIVGDGLQRPAADQQEVRVAQPEVDEQNGCFSPPLVGEPGWSPAKYRFESVGDHSKFGIQHAAPDQYGQQSRDGVGNDQQGANESS